MGARMGFDGVLNYKVGGIDGGGSWLELENVHDVTINEEKTEGEIKNRMSRFTRYLSGMVQLSIEFDMDLLPSYPGYVALRNANNSATRAGQIVGIQALDGGDVDEAGDDGEGIEFDCEVFRFHRNQPVDGPQTVSVTLKPTYSASPPRYVTS